MNGNTLSEKMLSEKEEQMLMKYDDGECSWLERLMLTRLRRRPEAKEFLRQKKSLEISMREISSDSLEVDLWDKISRRIDEEERTALYLGERRERQSNRVPWGVGNIGWGLSGAFVSASVVLFVMSGGTSGSIPQGADLPVQASNTSVLSASGASPVQVSRVSRPESVEVDWMRSDGRVRLIPDSKDRTAVIWVNRQPKASRRYVIQPSQSMRRSVGQNNGLYVTERQLPEALPATNNSGR